MLKSAMATNETIHPAERQLAFLGQISKRQIKHLTGLLSFLITRHAVNV